MRTLIFSDLHGDETGLQALFDHPEWHRADRHICAGDVVEFNEDCAAYYQRLQDAGVEILLGNHEAVLTGGCADTVFNPKVRPAIARTRQFLQDTHPDFLQLLSGLPARLTISEAHITHASFDPENPWKHVRYIEDVIAEQPHLPARINFLAHGHIPFIAWFKDGLWFYQRQIYGKTFHLESDILYVINTGSVLGSREMRWLEKTCLLYDDQAQAVTFFNLGKA